MIIFLSLYKISSFLLLSNLSFTFLKLLFKCFYLLLPFKLLDDVGVVLMRVGKRANDLTELDDADWVIHIMFLGHVLFNVCQLFFKYILLGFCVFITLFGNLQL